MLLSSAFLDGLILYYDDRFTCTSLKKNVFEFEIVVTNTSRFAPCQIRLKNVCRDERTGSGALFWNYPGYSYSGLGITEYLEY